MKRENQGDDDDRDLLGDPVSMVRDAWGRPSHEKTAENQALVSLLRAKKWTLEQIAVAIGCDIKTLRKHYSHELQNASDILEAKAMQVMLRRMEEGNVAAARVIMQIADDGRAAVPLAKEREAVDQGAGKDAAADPKPAKMGKKEQLSEAAQTPGALWGNLLN